METKALGASASVMGSEMVVVPLAMRSRRCRIRPSRSTVIQASAPVKGEAKRMVAVSPTA
jgi:hypothetical protein